MKKILFEKCFGWKFFLLQNHFPGNSLDEKSLVEIFFVCNIISSESLDEKNVGRKSFWSKFFLSKIFLLQNHFLGKSLDEKKIW
jgi:hypothetical protein